MSARGLARAGRARRRGPARGRGRRAGRGVPGGTPTARAAAAAVGCELAQIVKSLVFVCDGAYVLALVPGDRRADEAAIAAHARAAESSRSRGPDEVVHATGFEPGRRRAVPAARGHADADGQGLLPPRASSGSAPAAPSHMAALPPAELQRLSRRERRRPRPPRVDFAAPASGEGERRCRRPRRSG